MYISKKHLFIGMGGTFDHFHNGHRKFIEFAAEHGETLIIGITDKHFTVNKHFSTSIEPYQIRVNNVKAFCRQRGIPVQITKLTDPYGPAIEDNDITALCVTTETIKGGEKINEIRGAMGLSELPIFVCDLLTSETGEPLHAEAIRAGTVNRQGIVYASHFATDLILTEEQRHFFKTPLGDIVDLPAYKALTPQVPFIAVVGDTSLRLHLEQQWPFALAVYDGLDQRRPHQWQTIHELTPSVTLTNPAGQLSHNLWSHLFSLNYEKMLTQGANQRYLIKIDGEEDLVTSALILALPLESLIYYGQPNQGLVEVVVTEQLKDRVFRLYTG